MLFGESCHAARGEPAGDAHPARRGDHAPLRGQGARAGPRCAQRQHGLHLRPVLRAAMRPRHTRRCCSTRCSATPRCSRAPTKSRRPGASSPRCTTSGDGWDAKPAPDGELCFYEAGSWGPDNADQLIEHDGRRLAPPIVMPTGQTSALEVSRPASLGRSARTASPNASTSWARSGRRRPSRPRRPGRARRPSPGRWPTHAWPAISDRANRSASGRARAC